MRSGQTRLILAALVVAVFWGVVYWSAPASREPAVRVAGADQVVEPRIAPPVSPAPTDRLAMGAKTNTPPTSPRVAEPAPRKQDSIASLASVTQSPAAPPADAARDRAGVLAPQFREVVVQPGQTLMSIARQVYGDSKKWEAISRANPRLDPLRVKPGMTIRVPVDPKNIQGKEVGGAPSPNSTASASGAPSQQREAREASASPKEYVVQDGDTLGAIAKRTLGSSGEWQAILDANKSVISEPEDLRPGMRLKIPAKSGQ